MTQSKFTLGWLLIFLLSIAGAFADGKPPVAKIEVDGLGWIENRQTANSIKRLWGERLGAELTTNQIEDAALFIASNLTPKGYQRPTINVEAVLADGSRKDFTVDTTLQTAPPPSLRAKSVHFKVDRGVRSYLKQVTIEGLDVLKPEAGQNYFFNEIALIGGRGARAYSPARLARSADAIESTLRQRGYAEATVKVVDTQEDQKTGEVVAKVQVTEGARWNLNSMRFEIDGPDLVELAVIRARKDIPWSLFRGQDLAEEIRHAYFKRGYPDVRVRIETNPGPPVANVRPVEVVAHIQSGRQVGIGEVKFTGHQKTRESVLRRRVRIERGDPLNPLQLDKARYRLGRLGIFHSVDLSYEPPDGPVRDPIFTVSEVKSLEVNLMGGYGSYERLRGGVEVVQRNVFGRAHQSRIQLVQSFKSSRVNYTYSVPEIFGESIDGSAKLFGLQREERAFVRREYGGTVTLKRPLPFIGADGTIGYTYQSLRAKDSELGTRVPDEPTSPDGGQIPVASIDFTLSHEGRDNPLRPTKGLRWFLQTEFAARQLGGEVNYQRIETGASYHTSWGRGRWVHGGLSHGFITTLGSPDGRLPQNKRFFPGGESSIRGFTEGSAAPIGADGKFIGAKSYLLLNLELEQGLTKAWSIVAFTDALGEAASIRKYPFDTELLTVGLGLRYHTLIGPVRLEYGYNAKKRDEDARGTVHFSIGVPF